MLPLVSRRQIDGFLRGEELPAEVVEEIDRALDDPESEVSKLSAEYARITRMMFDPEGPLMAPPSEPVQEELHLIEQDLSAYQNVMAQRIQGILKASAEKKFSSLEEKRAFASRIQRLLNICEAKIQCPKCGEPAVLRCAVVSRAKNGVFRFEHHSKPRTVHGASSSLPAGLRIFRRVTEATPTTRKA